MSHQSFLRFSAVAAVACTVYLAQFVSPIGSVTPGERSSLEAAGSPPSAPARSAFAALGDQVSEWVANVTGATAGHGKTLVLSEPITIIRGPAYDGAQLPKGTAVKLLATEGDFLRVRYLQSVIMIPRSATVAGAYRLN